MQRNLQEQHLSNHHRSASPTNNVDHSKKIRNIKYRFLVWTLQRKKEVTVSLTIFMLLYLCQTIILKPYTSVTNTRGIKTAGSSNSDSSTTSPLLDPSISSYELDPPKMAGSSSSSSSTISQLLDSPISSFELDPQIPHILWFTYKENILKTKEPRHYYQNVKNTIKLYSKAFKDIGHSSHRSSKTRVEFMDDSDCLSHISLLVSEMKNDHPNMANLENHFIAESNGSFRSDICRLAALYLHGGYYFDVDMKVLKPFIAETFQSPKLKHPPLRKLIATAGNGETNELISEFNEKAQAKYGNKNPIESNDAYNITFLTVINEDRDTFFQSFLASIPRHPVIKLNLLILADFYENSKNLEWKLPDNKTVVFQSNKNILVGPATLYLAYFSETRVDPSIIGRDVIVEDVIKVPKTKDANKYIIRLNKRIRQKMDYFMSLIEPSNNLQNHIFNTSFILQETELKPGVLPYIPRQSFKPNFLTCNYIVHSQPEVKPHNLLERDVYFYSRILGSASCPKEASMVAPGLSLIVPIIPPVVWKGS